MFFNFLNKNIIKKKSILYYLLLFVLAFCSTSSANICESIHTSSELSTLYEQDHDQKLAALYKEYKDIYKYLEYPTQFIDRNTRPSSKIHTMVSGGDKPFSLLTKANHQAYADARGIQYRYVIPQEYSESLQNKRRYWLKVFVLKDLLYCDNIPENSWIMWVDDDIVINDFNDNIPMPDQYIEFFSRDYSLLVTDDIGDVKVNTGIILVQKNDKTRSFLHSWALYSSHPLHGYEFQGKTLHEQEVLRVLLYQEMFSALNNEIRLVKIVPSRRADLNVNFNTFKREGFVLEQGWEGANKLHKFQEGAKAWHEGDFFVHCGAHRFKPRIIMHTLDTLFSTFPKYDLLKFWPFC